MAVTTRGLDVPFHRRVAAALDPVVFARQAGYDLEQDPWQAWVARSRTKKIILNCSRQSGKSFVTAVIALHTALFTPGVEVVVVSYTQNQAKLVLRTCRRIFDRNTAGRRALAESVLTIEFDNRSRIIALPGKEGSVRGYSVGLLVIDEAAQVPDEVFDALGPTLSRTNGRQIILSTPRGTRGFFYDIWTQQERLAREDRTWAMVKVPVTGTSYITQEKLEEERAKGESYWRQEFLCEFLDSETQAFRREDIDRAMVDEDEAWAGLGFGA